MGREYSGQMRFFFCIGVIVAARGVLLFAGYCSWRWICVLRAGWRRVNTKWINIANK